MSVEYTYNEEQALKADDGANRITEGGAYVGAFKRAWEITTQKGGKGIQFEFESPGLGSVSFALYTQGADGTPFFGLSFVNAIQFMLGLKGFKGEPGQVEVWDDAAGGRIEKEGVTFPALCNKPVGLVFWQELYTNGKGGDATRLNLEGVYQPETKLLFSELKAKQTKPVKLERLLRKVAKPKDSRKRTSADPAQPAIGGGYGDF